EKFVPLDDLGFVAFLHGDDLFKPRAPVSDAFDQGKKALLRDQERGLGVMQDIMSFVGGEGSVDRNEDSANFRSSENSEEKLRAVVEQKRNSVAFFDACAHERVRHLTCGARQIAIRVTPVAMKEEQAVGVF